MNEVYQQILYKDAQTNLYLNKSPQQLLVLCLKEYKNKHSTLIVQILLNLLQDRNKSGTNQNLERRLNLL